MNELFPGGKRFVRRDDSGKFSDVWHTVKLNWKAKVVCEPCNGGWMSDIESRHAKPDMTDLIRGVPGIQITRSIAYSVALFAFKTAVVFDHLQSTRAPFFRRSVRYRFRESLEIPPTVRMWMGFYLPQGTGGIHTGYHEGEHRLCGRIELYTCTYVVGHLIFQVCAERWRHRAYLAPRPGFENSLTPFWPSIQQQTIWPPSHSIMSVEDFYKFATRWIEIDAWFLTGRG